MRLHAICQKVPFLALSAVLAALGGPLPAADPPRIVLEPPPGGPFTRGDVVKVPVWLETEAAAFKFIAFGVEGNAGADVWFAPSPDLIVSPGVGYFIDRLVDVRRVSAGLGDFDFDRNDLVIAVPDGRLRIGTVDVQVNVGPAEVSGLTVAVGDCDCAQKGISLKAVLDLGTEMVEPLGDSLTIAVGDHDFRRGDSNGDGRTDLSDAIRTVNALFTSTSPIICPDALDANDDGRLDVSDPVYVLSFLFQNGPPPAPPTRRRGPIPPRTSSPAAGGRSPVAGPAGAGGQPRSGPVPRSSGGTT